MIYRVNSSNKWIIIVMMKYYDNYRTVKIENIYCMLTDIEGWRLN